jgi:uncharacterized cupin superfamily protein
MLQQLCIPNAHSCAQPFEDRPFIANSHLFVTEAGNVVIDPLPFDDATHRQIETLGGVARVMVLTQDRRAVAEGLAARYGATLILAARDREELFPGATAIRLPDQRRADAFAVSIPGSRTVVVGDDLIGSPGGALSMPADNEYADACKAALGLRRILRENSERLLLAYGQSIYAGAYAAVYGALFARAGAEVHRINVDELDYRDERDERSDQPEQFHVVDAEVGFVIGARGLGYRVSTLAPGQRFCPLHSHAREEELFFVLDGTPSVRTLAGTIRCRKGDFIALPVGETGTHQLLNESDAPVTVLLLARTEEVEVCYYPDSDKLLVDTDTPLVDHQRSIIVKASPQVDYFHGEA